MKKQKVPFITHVRYKREGMSGKYLNLPYGTEVDCYDNIITTKEGVPICFTTSENAKLHFATNEDGNGLERGELTRAIAYDQREGDGKSRFTDDEREMIEKNYKKFLRKETGHFLFDKSFFDAPIDELREMADSLKIKVKGKK